MPSGIELGIDNLTGTVLIGSGGFSQVYAATDTQFDRRVAVKVLGKLHSDADRRRFDRECRVMGRLSAHPNVVTVYSAGYTRDQRPYLVMELIEGGTLADRLRHGQQIDWEPATDYLIPICGALQRAHDEGILHRDVKPENILLGEGTAKLTDFGIAYLRDATGAVSTSITASWLHTAPETFDNQRDERSDIYSVASTLYALIVGSAPFWRSGEESLNPLIRRLLDDPPPPLPSDLAPRSLDRLLRRALAKEPAERPASAGELAHQLQEVRDTAAVPAADAGLDPRPGQRPPPSAHPAPAPNLGAAPPPWPAPPPTPVPPTWWAPPSHPVTATEPVAVARTVGASAPAPSPFLVAADPPSWSRPRSGSRWPLLALAGVAVAAVAAVIGLTQWRDAADDDAGGRSEQVADGGSSDGSTGAEVGESATGGDGGDGQGGETPPVPAGPASFTLLGPDGSEDGDAIQGFVDAYNQETGSAVDFTAATDSEDRLQIMATGGDPPDVALTLRPATVCELADSSDPVSLEEMGFDIAGMEASHSPYWIGLGQCADGNHYGIPWFTYFKSAVFYHEPTFDAMGYEIPQTFDDLVALSAEIVSDGLTPWCFGFESFSASGWPGTDWLEDIYLDQNGVDAYQRWYEHEIPFNDPTVLQAFDTFAEIFFADGYVAGGTGSVATTHFGDSTGPLFSEPPGCLMLKQGSFMTAFFSAQPGYVDGEESEIDVFPFPTSGRPAAVGGGQTLIVFDAAPETVQAIRDWVTPEWQCTLASASGGGIAPHGGHGVAGVELFPGHSGTDPGCYDSDAGQTFAAATVDALAAGTFAFDASDQMPAAVGQGTFWSGMIDWSQGASSQAVADAIEESWPG